MQSSSHAVTEWFEGAEADWPRCHTQAGLAQCQWIFRQGLERCQMVIEFREDQHRFVVEFLDPQCQREWAVLWARPGTVAELPARSDQSGV